MKTCIFALALALAGAAAFAEGRIAADSNHQGFYYAFPAYLYGTSSASGLQVGYQLKNLHFRLDASVVAEVLDGRPVIFASPSIGVFYSHDWESKIRTYTGIALGAEKGILNSFQDPAFFANIMTGAEWFVFERKAVFLEIGSGVGYPSKDSAYNGGTVIGGGIKCFF